MDILTFARGIGLKVAIGAITGQQLAIGKVAAILQEEVSLGQ